MVQRSITRRARLAGRRRDPAGARNRCSKAAKAGAIGGKGERGSRMLTAYERDQIRHVRARIPCSKTRAAPILIKKPYDLAGRRVLGMGRL